MDNESTINIDNVFNMDKDELVARLHDLHVEYMATISQSCKLASLKSHVITMAHKVAVAKRKY